MSLPEEKRHNKSKDEILHDMDVQVETTRQRRFVKDVLYPWLIENSKSIDDAKNMLYAATIGVQQTFHVAVSKEQTRLSTIKLSELDVEKNILAGEQYDRDRQLLSLFKDEPVATAESLLKGAKMFIEGLEKEESTKRLLVTLPAEHAFLE